MDAVTDFVGNEITPGASVVYAAKHRGLATLRKSTVISVSPRLLVRTTARERAWTAWVRDPQRVVVMRERWMLNGERTRREP